MESEDEGLVRTAEIPGRGRGVVSCKPLRAGQIVLRDSPILLYSASPLTTQQHSSYNYCNNCFRNLQQQQQITLLSCPNCSNHRFCGSACLSAATSSSHSPWACQSLSRLRDFPSLHNQPLERHLQLRFLVAAYNLAFFNPSYFQSLLSLQPHSSHTDNVDEETQFLHSVISTLCPPPSNTSFFDLQLTSTLLAKDKLNSFALMEPFSVDGQRSVRAYGVYPNASLFNHDCLPNACRFDYVDSTVDASNTDIIVRMIHDVPQGREICLSYFPVNWDYPTRQKRLLEDYGFYCQCDRCKVEANWSDNDDDKDDIVDDENEAMVDDEDEEHVDDDVMEATEEDVDSNFPHVYFFVRYMCDRENCGGTLAPLPPSDPRPSSLLECNVCGNIKKDEIVDADLGGAS